MTAHECGDGCPGCADREQYVAEVEDQVLRVTRSYTTLLGVLDKLVDVLDSAHELDRAQDAVAGDIRRRRLARLADELTQDPDPDHGPD